MAGSNFPFITDPILRQNLDDAFQHIVVLIPFSESATYNDAAKNSFRKTIIIYTASIIEALLFHLVDKKLNEQDLVDICWELTNKQVLYDVSDSHQIVAGDWKQKITATKKDKLNLGGINSLLKSKKIIGNVLYDKVDLVRKLRNSQHIGPHTSIKSFPKWISNRHSRSLAT